MTTPLIIPPNIPAVVTGFLRAQPEVAAIAGSRVYTEIPQSPAWPLVRVTQFNEQPASRTRLIGWQRSTWLQVDAFGGTKAAALQLAQTAAAALLARLSGRLEYGTAAAVVTGTEVRGLADQPDEGYSPARPRWRFDLIVHAHPIPAPAG